MGLFGGGDSKSDVKSTNEWEALTQGAQDDAAAMQKSKLGTVARDEAFASGGSKNMINMAGGNQFRGGSIGTFNVLDSGAIENSFQLATVAMDRVTESAAKTYDFMDNAFGMYADTVASAENTRELEATSKAGLPFSQNTIIAVAVLGLGTFLLASRMRGRG